MPTIAEKLQREIDRANNITKKSDTTVHNAVGSLIAGYGQGGSAEDTYYDAEPTNVINGKWIRPESWQDIESIELPDDDTSIVYLLYENSQKQDSYISVDIKTNTGTYTIQQGHVENGQFIGDKPAVEKTGTGTSSAPRAFNEIIESDYDTVIYKITSQNRITAMSFPVFSYNGKNLTGQYQQLLMRYGQLPYVTTYPSNSATGIMTLESDNLRNLKSLTSCANAFSACYSLKRVRMDGWDVSKVTTYANMFSTCYSLIDIVCDFTGWVTNSCTTIASMFSNCYLIKNIIAKNWDTTSLTTLAGVFAGCRNLIKVEGIEEWDLSQGPILCGSNNGTFQYCYSLIQDEENGLDLSNWRYGRNSTKTQTMTQMFYGAYKLRKINFSNWDFSNISSLNNTFYTCYSLQEIIWNEYTKLPKDGRLTAIGGLYQNCYNIKTILPFYKKTKNDDGTEYDDYFNFNSITSGSSIFASCFYIKSIDMGSQLGSPIGSSVNTQTVWFQTCYSLENLDLSGIDLSKITYVTSQFTAWFTGCYGLINFYPPKKISKNFTLSYSSKLSKESLLRTIENLETVTTATTLTLGPFNVAKLTDEQIAVATNKGWTVS